MKFNKPALTLSQQLQKLLSRGLAVPDTTQALHCLQFIGYYRLSAYTLPFQDPAHPDKHFRPGKRFEDVLQLYVFDRELRRLLLDAIERVEVGVRTCLVIVHYMLGITAPKSRWHERLVQLLGTRPVSDLGTMGFPMSWNSETFRGFGKDEFTI